MSSSGSHQGSVVRVSRLAAFGAALALSIACAGGGDSEGADTGAATPGGTQQPAGGATGDFNEQSITPQMLALGDSVFRGQAAGGICYTCHQADASGMPGMGPNLRDDQWLNTDGTLNGIATIVRNGVLQPKEASVPMPAQGPPVLSEQHVRAVAAYVYSLSHPNVGSKSGN